MQKTAVIFSWDVLVPEFAELANKSWKETASVNNLAFPINSQKRGLMHGNAYTITNVLNWTDDAEKIAKISQERNNTFHRLVTETGVTACPGAREILLALQKAKVPCAVICRDERENIDFVVRTMAFDTLLPVVISQGDATETAASESDFTNAMAALKRSPKETIVVENSVKNVETAIQLGIKTIAIAPEETRELFENLGASIVFSALQELDLSTIMALRSLKVNK